MCNIGFLYQFNFIHLTAWTLVGEEKTCDDTEGVTISSKGTFTNIVDCATSCKAKLQITMFAFETKEGCDESETGCQCYCIESATNECTTKNEEGFTLYKFLQQELGIIVLYLIRNHVIKKIK